MTVISNDHYQGLLDTATNEVLTYGNCCFVIVTKTSWAYPAVAVIAAAAGKGVVRCCCFVSALIMVTKTSWE